MTTTAYWRLPGPLLHASRAQRSLAQASGNAAARYRLVLPVQHASNLVISLRRASGGVKTGNFWINVFLRSAISTELSPRQRM